LRFTWTGYGDDVIDNFREKSLFFRDTSSNQEHDAKNRLSISGPSPEKPVAEIIPLKENRPKILAENHQNWPKILAKNSIQIHLGQDLSRNLSHKGKNSS